MSDSRESRTDTGRRSAPVRSRMIWPITGPRLELGGREEPLTDRSRVQALDGTGLELNGRPRGFSTQTRWTCQSFTLSFTISTHSESVVITEAADPPTRVSV